jgi:hypothetical protein
MKGIGWGDIGDIGNEVVENSQKDGKGMPKAKTKTQLVEETAQSELLEEEVLYVAPAAGQPLIYSKMVNVMADMQAITKNRQSTGGSSFKFRGIDEVMNAMHPILVRHQVFCTPLIMNVENKVFEQDKTNPQGQKIGTRNMFQAIITACYTFYTIDGSFVEAVVCAESSDYSDKSTQQALSYCFKAAMLQTFCIPTQDTTDGDERTPPDLSGKSVSPVAGTGRNYAAPAGSRLAEMPKLADRPPIKEATPQAPDEPDAGETPLAAVKEQPVPVLTEADWQTIKNILVPLNVSDAHFHKWSIMTLRAAGLTVPKNMSDVSKSSGKTLWQVAVASAKAGQLLTEIEPAD